MLLVLIMIVMVVVGIKVKSLLVSVELVSLFNSCEESATRLVTSEMRIDAIESAKTLVSRFIESNQIIWLNQRCEITGGSVRVRVMQVNGLTAVLRDCISNAIYTVNVVDMIEIVK